MEGHRWRSPEDKRYARVCKWKDRVCVAGEKEDTEDRCHH